MAKPERCEYGPGRSQVVRRAGVDERGLAQSRGSRLLVLGVDDGELDGRARPQLVRERALSQARSEVEEDVRTRHPEARAVTHGDNGPAHGATAAKEGLGGARVGWLRGGAVRRARWPALIFFPYDGPRHRRANATRGGRPTQNGSRATHYRDTVWLGVSSAARTGGHEGRRGGKSREGE
eukprot:scaffold81970_cov22-Tisochrysis_lutea.AAC.2